MDFRPITHIIIAHSYSYQGWQEAGFYSYCPGRRLLPAFTGFK